MHYNLLIFSNAKQCKWLLFYDQMKKDKSYSLRTTDENYSFLEQMAAEDDRSVANIINRMVSYFKNKGTARAAVKELNK